MRPRVRDAVPDDAAEIRAVASAAWQDTYAGLLQPSTIGAFVEAAYSVEMLERRIARDTFLVAERDGPIVAFANAVIRDNAVNLAAIYTLPNDRGQGLGTMLLTVLRSRFPGLSIAADVLRGNRKGETFYERRGFAPREILHAELFGEPVVERRWWLGIPPPQVNQGDGSRDIRER
jgi:GNAT superfamily N-acetyltransferase